MKQLRYKAVEQKALSSPRRISMGLAAGVHP